MSTIKMLHASNVISRQKGRPLQSLEFTMLVDNRAYEKQVIVHWSNEAGEWQQLPAGYAYSCGGNWEVWRAQTQIKATESVSLPGNVRFVVEGHMAGHRYCDNNFGQEFELQADAGVRIPNPELPVMVLDHEPRLRENQRLVTVTVAVNRQRRAQRVFMRWTTDNWKTFKETKCTRHKTYWHRTHSSNARNPNQYGSEVWTGRMRIGNAYRLQYVVGCEVGDKTYWDSNFGGDYTAIRGRLKMLTLNLHCYQEANQYSKFCQIARLIRDMDVDIVCLQEVGENWNSGHGDWGSNAARIINEQLPLPYHLHTDWSHIGFDRYREGVAILSRYPFHRQSSGYVSHNHDVHSIHSRKVVMAQIDVPYIGRINVFSAHLSWWSDGFAQQFDNLRRWADGLHTTRVAGTLLCGDFNISAGSDGYSLLVDTRDYEDQFLKMHNRAAFDQVFRHRSYNWRDVLVHDGRIDYIWLKKKSQLKAVSAKEVLTDWGTYGRVSDHTGYIVEFERI